MFHRNSDDLITFSATTLYFRAYIATLNVLVIIFVKLINYQTTLV